MVSWSGPLATHFFFSPAPAAPVRAVQGFGKKMAPQAPAKFKGNGAGNLHTDKNATLAGMLPGQEKIRTRCPHFCEVHACALNVRRTKNVHMTMNDPPLLPRACPLHLRAARSSAQDPVEPAVRPEVRAHRVRREL
eukprot:gene11115-biopygen7826